MQPETRAAQFDYDDDPPDKTDGGAASKKAVHEVYGPAPITEQTSGTGKGTGKAGAAAEEKPEEKSKAADKSLSEGWTNLKKDKDFSTESVDRYVSSLDTAISARLKLIDPETLNKAKELAKMNGNSRAEKLALLSMTDPDLSADIQRARNIYTLLGYNATPQLFSLELRKQLAKESLIADKEKSLGRTLKDDEKIALTVNLDFDDEEALDRAIRANLKDKFPTPEPGKKQSVDYKDIAGQLEITENEAKELHARYMASFQEKKDDRDKGTLDALGDWASNHAGTLTVATLFMGTVATSVALRALLNRRRSAAAGRESESSANRGEQARNDRTREESGRRSTRQEEQASREQARPTESNREGEGNARSRWSWRRSGTNTGSGTDSSPPEGESQTRSRWSWRRSGTNTGSGTDSSPPEGESQTRSRWSWRRSGTNTGSGTDSRPEGEGNAGSRWSFSQWWQRRRQAGNADQSEQRQTGPEGNNADQTRSEQGPVEQRTFDNIPSFLAGSVQNMQPSEAAKLMVRAVVIGRAEYDRHEAASDRNVFEHIKTDLEDATRAIRAAGDVPQPVKDACDRVAQQIAGDRDATVNIVRQQMSRLQSQFGDSRSGPLDRFVWSEVVNNPRVVESLAERVIEAEEAARQEGFVTDRNARVDITNEVIAELSRLSPVRAFLDSRTQEVIRDLIMAKVHQTVGEPAPGSANGNAGLGEMVPFSARSNAGADANAGRDEQIKAEKERIKENRTANFLYGGLERGLLVNLPEGWNQVIEQIKSDPLYRDGAVGETQRDALDDLIGECEQARDSGKYHSPAEYFASKLDRYSETRTRFVEESLKTLVDGAQVTQEMSTDAFTKVRDHLQACLQVQSQSLPADAVANIKTNIIEGFDWAISVSSGAAPTQSPIDFINDLESTARSKSGEWESVAKSPWAMAQELQSPAAVERSLVENLKRYARSTQEPGQPPGDKIDLDGNSKTNRKRMAQYIEKGPLKARTDAGTGKPLAGQEAAHAALTKLAAALRKNSAGNSVEDILKAGIIADPIGKDGSPFIARQSGGTFEAFRRVGTEIEKYNPATKVYDKVQPDAVFEAVASSIEAAAKSTTDNSKAQELNIYAQELRTIGGDPKAEAFKELLGALEIPEEKAREKALEGVYAKGQSLVFVAKWLTGAGLSLSALLLNQGAAGKGRSMRAPNPGAFEGISF